MSAAPQVFVSPLEHLRRIRPGRHPIVSCYVRLQAADRQGRRYLLQVRERIQNLLATLPALALDRGQREAVTRDLERIVTRLGNSQALPHTEGLGLFASEGRGMFEVISLPTLFRTRLDVGRLPRLLELVEAEESFGNHLAVVLDRSHARFFVIRASDTLELPGLRPAATRGGKFHSDRQDAPGWGEFSYHNRIREERHRYYAGIEHELRTLAAAWHPRGIALAGPSADVTAAAHFLSPTLGNVFLGTARLIPREATTARVREVVLKLARARDRETQREVIVELGDRMGTGWAVEGPRETLRALARGQARTLLIRADAHGTGFRCRDTGALVLARGDCRGQGDALPVPDLIDEALDEAMRQRVTVVVLDDPDAAEAVDGMAAFLRFR